MSETVPDGERQDIESLYAAFNDRDIDAVLDRLAEDVQWANGMEGGHLEGRAAVREYWRRQFDIVQSQVEPRQISRTNEGRVAAKVHQVVRDSKGELLADQHVTHLFTFYRGQITRFDIGSD